MELLIPGLILVGLMIYASTRIKKTAAAAFEAETIDNESFFIEKPEGFLSVIGGDPKLEFEAYSREFGDGHAANIRQARVEIRKRSGDLKLAETEISRLARIVSKTTKVIDQQKYLFIESAREENDVEFVDMHKLSKTPPGVLELRIIALSETNEDLGRKIDLLFDGFRVK